MYFPLLERLELRDLLFFETIAECSHLGRALSLLLGAFLFLRATVRRFVRTAAIHRGHEFRANELTDHLIPQVTNFCVRAACEEIPELACRLDLWTCGRLDVQICRRFNLRICVRQLWFTPPLKIDDFLNISRFAGLTDY